MAYSKNRRLAEIVSDTSGNLSVEGIVVPTQSTSDNDTSAASTAFVHAHIDAVLDSAPGTLNTLNEIAAALNDDANFNTTVTNAIAAKLPLAGGTLTGALTVSATTATVNITGGNSGASLINFGDAADGNVGRIYYDHTDDFMQFKAADGERFRINSTGIDVSGVITSKADGAVNDAQIGRLNFTNTNSNASSNPIRTSILSGRQNSAWGGYLSLYTSTGTDAATEKVRIGATGNVGIGETNPDASLHITSNTPVISFDESDAGQEFRIGSFGGAFALYDSTDSAYRLVVDGSGSVGIGETSPLGKLHVKEGDSGQGSVNANFDQLVLEDDAHSGMTILSGTSSDGGIYFGDSGGNNMGQFKYKHSSNSFAFVTNNGSESFVIANDGLAEFTSTRNEWAMRLKSASNRGGIVFDKPGTTSVMGSVLMLESDETFRLGTASNYHVRMDQSGNTYMGNTSSTHFTQNGNLSVNTTTANSGITSGTDVRALGPCFANDANSFTMSQEGSGNTDAYLAARGANSSARGNIHIGVSVSGGGNFKSGLIVDSEGRSTTPENPAFRARATSGQSLASSWRVVGYDTLLESRGSGYSTTTSRFTAPVAGWYQFNAQWSANNNSDSDGTFAICINGSYTDLAGSISIPNTGGSYDGHTVSGCCYLDVNDYVDVRRYSSVSTTTRGSNPYGGWFSGFLIG